jgi:hypothetical protein
MKHIRVRMHQTTFNRCGVVLPPVFPTDCSPENEVAMVQVLVQGGAVAVSSSKSIQPLRPLVSAASQGVDVR